MRRGFFLSTPVITWGEATRRRSRLRWPKLDSAGFGLAVPNLAPAFAGAFLIPGDAEGSASVGILLRSIPREASTR